MEQHFPTSEGGCQEENQGNCSNRRLFAKLAFKAKMIKIPDFAELSVTTCRANQKYC
jgi:hypothetical protein